MDRAQLERDLASLIFATSARVAPSMTPEADLLTLARARAMDPAVFDETAPYFWMAEISNSNIDAYFTQMQESTLKNFAADAAAGVSFQNSHATYKLGFGRSLTGTYATAPTGGAVTAEFYTLPNLRLHDVGTDDFIRGVRSGILADVSVGFYGGTMRCSVCGCDMWRSWDCWHIPGLTYQMEDAGGAVVREVTAIGLIEDAHLAEVSVVYDGATPGAAILKAQFAAQEGRLTQAQARLLEHRYRMRLPDPRRSVAGVAVPQRTEDPMPSTDPTATPTPAQDPSRAAPPEPTSTAPEHQEQPAEVRDLSARLTATQQERDVAVARTRELESEVTRLTGEVARLAPLADVGTQYRTDLIAEALAEGVRAVGSEFAEETYRALLQGASLEVIKRMRDDWQATASRMFTPGRRTVDSAAPSAPADPTDRTPPQAYQ